MKALTNTDNLIFQTFLTVEFLEALHESAFLNSDYYDSLPQSITRKTEFSEIGIGNQGTLLMFLYALLVVPKEVLSNEFNEQYRKIELFLRQKATRIESTYKKQDLVRHLRNSVSHAKVEFEPNQHVIFKDSNSRTGEVFEMELKLKYVGGLIVELKKIHSLYASTHGGSRSTSVKL